MKSHHLQAFKVHYLLLYNLFSLLYIVNNNCFGDWKCFLYFWLALCDTWFVLGKGFQFYEEKQEKKVKI